jgi:predicted alpha/beta superfamily hydrolase
MVCLLAKPAMMGETEQSSRQIPHTLTGNVQLLPKFHSKYLPVDRKLIVYLPPGYNENQTKSYPVLYMQDGQNLFDEATSFFFGMERHFDEKAQYLIRHGQMQPLIVVGIYSTESRRFDEYTPPGLQGTQGGEGDLYGRMLVEEIKPFIDSHYRTLSGASNTGLGGSSLGGVVTMYVGLKYPNVFGKLAITSPAAFVDDELIVRYVRSINAKTNQRIWLSVGTGELSGFVNSTRSLRDALISKGWREGRNLGYVEALREQHNPDGWSRPADRLLTFLFPPR